MNRLDRLREQLAQAINDVDYSRPEDPYNIKATKLARVKNLKYDIETATEEMPLDELFS